MGVKTRTTLKELNNIFDDYHFLTLTPTTSGIMDTTYIVTTQSADYILKRYERDLGDRVYKDAQHLQQLKESGLNVPLCVDEAQGWYLYTKLKGTQTKAIRAYHIQSLARFMAKMHQESARELCNNNDFMNGYDINRLLTYTKTTFFSYYKKLQFLSQHKMTSDGLIHGDLFKDNAVFDERKIGVFDFIDSACGSFAFDVAVAFVGFGGCKRRVYHLNIFLQAYNQHAPQKLSSKEVLVQIKIAKAFYTLLRINANQNIFKVKELL